MSLNLFTANGSLGNGDANAFLNCVVVFVSRETEKGFGKFVITRYNIFDMDVGLEFFNLERIQNSFCHLFYLVERINVPFSASGMSYFQIRFKFSACFPASQSTSRFAEKFSGFFCCETFHKNHLEKLLPLVTIARRCYNQNAKYGTALSGKAKYGKARTRRALSESELRLTKLTAKIIQGKEEQSKRLFLLSKMKTVKANEPFQFCAEFHLFRVGKVNPS